MGIVLELLDEVMDGDIKYIYKYKLVKNNVEVGDIGMKAYGIQVERKDYRDDSCINELSDEVSGISPYRHKVQELLKVLFNNKVSPLHLVDIIGEQVDYYVEDFYEVEMGMRMGEM